jgi:poly-gamma-glutamate capsule biosynthesis protein CapA/YwtB (metallophosphatase superfamily)
MTVPAIIFIVLLLGTMVILYVMDDLVFGKDYMTSWDRDVCHFVVSVLVGISGSLLALIAQRILELFNK